MKKILIWVVLLVMVCPVVFLNFDTKALAGTSIVKKEYPTLPQGYEISQQFTYDTEGNNSTPSCAYDGNSQKVTLDNPESETRYSVFSEGQGILYDGSGVSFWYKSDTECTLVMEDLIWLYLEPAPKGRWVTYYYNGKIFYDNDSTDTVKYKSDVNPDIRSVIDPEKKYNICFYRGKGEYYIDEIFTFKVIATNADKYQSEEQAFKFSLAKYESDTDTSADYVSVGKENGYVELYPDSVAGEKACPVDITYNLTESDRVQFQKAVEKAQEGSGYLKIQCDDIICEKDGEDQFAKLCITFMHTGKTTNQETGQIQYTDKKLTKWIIGSGSSETFLIDVRDITEVSDLSQIRIRIYADNLQTDKIRFRLSPITVYHYPENEIIVPVEWLKDHTTQNGEKLPENTAIAYDEENDTNRQFLYVPNKRASITEIELPQLAVGEYEVYANMRLDTSKTLYTIAVNNRIQDMDKYFKFFFTNPNEKYDAHTQIINVSLGRIKIAKDYSDGSSKLKFISFYGSGAECERTQMYIAYLSLRKTGNYVTRESSDNFILKEYPQPEDYEKLTVLNDFNDFVRSGDNRYNETQQVYGYVGDKTGFNLNSRKITGQIQAAANLVWNGLEGGLDGSGVRCWIKFDIQDSDTPYTNWLTFFDKDNQKVALVSVNVEKSGNKYTYTVKYENEVIDSGEYSKEKGAWVTIYYKDIVPDGDLSHVTQIGMYTENTCYVDELHTIQQKSGTILYEADEAFDTAWVAGANLRVEDVIIEDKYKDATVSFIKAEALNNILTLKTVQLAKSVERIEENAFAGDRNLTSINLDAGVRVIKAGAFKGCKKLGEVNFSEKISEIAEDAFAGCDNLIMVVPYGSYAYKYAVENNINYCTKTGEYEFYKIGSEIHIADYLGEQQQVVIPDQIQQLPVTKVLEKAFYQKSIKKIYSETVTEVATEAFAECTELESAEFTHLVTLGERAFTKDVKLTYVDLPQTVTEIAASAFSQCSDKLIARVEKDTYAYQFVNAKDTAICQMPDTDSVYKYSLFRYEATIIGYTGEEEILQMPSTIDGYTVIAVGEAALQDNTTIREVTLPQKCKRIYDSAFSGCENLRKIDLSPVLHIGHYSFQNCAQLKEVTVTNVAKYHTDTFDAQVKIKVANSQFQQTAMELTDSWHAGINLGCKFDTAGYNTYGTYTMEETKNLFAGDITKEYIQFLSDSGFDVIRLPITWTAFVDDADNYTIDAECLNRVQEIVDWIVEEGMYVIINTHHDSSEYDMEKGWLNLYNYSEKTCEKYERIWQQIGERFQDYDQHLIFESMNEPRYENQWDPKNAKANEYLNDLQQRFYRVVRESGGNNAQRYLMLETYAAALKVGQCSDFVTYWKDTFQTDEHLMVSVHFYNNNIGEENFDYAIGLIQKYFTDNNMPCVIGESATQTHFSLSELKENKEKQNVSVVDREKYEKTGEISYITQTVNARDYDDWYVATWLDKFLNVSDKYGIKLIYWEDSGSMTLGVKGSDPWWYFPSAIDVFMNHSYKLTVDGEQMEWKDLAITLPKKEGVSYYTNGKSTFQPGVEVTLREVKENTELVSVQEEVKEVPSLTPTVSPIATLSPTVTLSPAVTLSPTVMLSPAASLSPAATVSPAVTLSPAASLSPAVTLSPAASLSPVVTLSPAATLSPTVSPTQVRIQSPAPKPTATQVKELEQLICSRKQEEAPKEVSFHQVRLELASTTDSTITLKWKKVKNASGYIIYGNRCGKQYRYKKLKTIQKGSVTKTTIRKLAKGKYYKFILVAVKESREENQVIATSKTAHIAVAGGKAGNDKAVEVTNRKSRRVQIKVGKSFLLRARSVLPRKDLKVSRHRKLSYESTNSKVATVNRKGKITGVKKGTCYVYIYNQSGNYCRVKVTVK